MAYLVVLDCLGTALVELPGEMNFIVSGFEVGFEVELTFQKCEGFRGAGALRGPIDSNRSLAVTSNLRIFLAAWKLF